MSSDDVESTDAPTADDVADAYRVYQATRAIYLQLLRRHVQAQPAGDDPLFLAAHEQWQSMRVLHALAVGYGWSDVIYRVCSRAEVAEVQLQGLAVKRGDKHGGYVLTEQGAERLRRWIEHVMPLRDLHPRYAELWSKVTGLNG